MRGLPIRSCKGFTLIELMIVIAVIAILVVIAVPNYNDYNNNQKLAEATNQLQTVLREAQNNAQTGKVCSVTSKATDWHADFTVDAVNYSFAPTCESGSVAAKQTDLVSGLSISKVAVVTKPVGLPATECALSTNTTGEVKFNNISSSVSFSAPGCPDNTNASLEITLSLISGNSRTVVIEKGGGIYVKNQ